MVKPESEDDGDELLTGEGKGSSHGHDIKAAAVHSE